MYSVGQMRRDSRRYLCRRQIIASEPILSGNQYRICEPLGVTNPRLWCTSWGFYLEKRRERGVVAEYVGAQSLPTPRRPATQNQLRGPLGVTDRRHFSAALIMFYAEKRQKIRAVAEYVGE